MSSTNAGCSGLISGLPGLALLALGCGSEPLAQAPSETPFAIPDADARMVQLFEPPANYHATALAFDPTRPGELWVTLRRPPTTAACTKDIPDGCAALVGQIALVKGASGDSPTTEILRDGNAWHFMRRPTAIAFGDNGNLATCGEALSDNYTDDTIDYAGPVLWSSDPTIFGVKPMPGQNGTHLDMLHETPYCMGIEHERDNVYWTFNGKLGALDRYDFREPHVIGGEDHGDGEVYRYVAGELARAPEVPSHLVLDAARRELYVADTGNQRVVRLNIDDGTMGADIPTNDMLAVHRQVDGALLIEVVQQGELSAPSGLAFHDDTLIVSDANGGRLYFFDRHGVERGRFATGLTAVSGVTIGPDGLLYVADRAGGAYRIQRQ